MAPTLSLRVDIDTFHGCRDGIAPIARELDALGVRATFFVVTGRDTSGRHMKRITTPGYLRRLRAVNVFDVLKRLRLRSLLYGTVLPGPRVAAGNAALLRALRASGHELGLHGNDHARWADDVDSLTEDEALDAWRRAGDDFAEMIGARATSAAAPNWRVSDAALHAFDRLPMDYRSDVRGRGAFYPTVEGRACATLQLPVDLPACHELLASCGCSLEETPAKLLATLDPAAPNVWNLHDWFEGLRAPWLVRPVVEGARAMGYEVVTMAEAAGAAKARGAVPSAAVARRAVPGGVGTVSCRVP